MAWVALVAAGLFETGFAVSLKLSHGLTALRPTVAFALCALISFGLLTVALRDLGVGPAYAVSAAKLVSIALILVGVIGLNLSGVTP